MRRDSNSLWAITSYFNPVGYERRIRNYRAFRRYLAVPLVAVELSFDGRFELQREDADILVQIRGDSILWQKERLLNIALTHVPAACGKVAWIDCDVIFAGDDWVERADRALDECGLVHLFHERHDLPRDADLEHLRFWHAPPTAESVVHKIATGRASPEDLSLANAPVERRSTAGLAWASSRAILEKHGLYDACIVGSGDRVILCAALGKFAYGERATLMNARQAEHYLRWAQAYYKTLRGRVNYIEGRLLHLWHGKREERRYEERHRAMKTFDFDPLTDIATDSGGCWRWNSDKTTLHTHVKQYFEARDEDGRMTKGFGFGSGARPQPTPMTPRRRVASQRPDAAGH